MIGQCFYGSIKNFFVARSRISAPIALRRAALEESDDNLVRQAQRGDQSAFDALCDKHRPRILAYCVRLLGNKEHGEEVTQEVFVKAWVHRGSYRFESPFGNWLIRIATFTCRNRYRTQETQGELNNSSMDTPDVLAVVEARSSQSGMEDAILQQVYAQQLLLKIRQIAKTAKPPWDELDWSIFHLLYEENVSQAREVARRLGKSENTVKSRIYHRINGVLKRVGEILQAEEETSLQQTSV